MGHIYLRFTWRPKNPSQQRAKRMILVSNSTVTVWLSFRSPSKPLPSKLIRWGPWGLNMCDMFENRYSYSRKLTQLYHWTSPKQVVTILFRADLCLACYISAKLNFLFRRNMNYIIVERRKGIRKGNFNKTWNVIIIAILYLFHPRQTYKMDTKVKIWVVRNLDS